MSRKLPFMLYLVIIILMYRNYKNLPQTFTDSIRQVEVKVEVEKKSLPLPMPLPYLLSLWLILCAFVVRDIFLWKEKG